MWSCSQNIGLATVRPAGLPAMPMHSLKFLRVDKAYSDHVAIVNYLTAFVLWLFSELPTNLWNILYSINLKRNKNEIFNVYICYYTFLCFAGILAGMWPCGILVLLSELFTSESKCQIFASLHELLKDWDGILTSLIICATYHIEGRFFRC